MRPPPLIKKCLSLLMSRINGGGHFLCEVHFAASPKIVFVVAAEGWVHASRLTIHESPHRSPRGKDGAFPSRESPLPQACIYSSRLLV